MRDFSKDKILKYQIRILFRIQNLRYANYTIVHIEYRCSSTNTILRTQGMSKCPNVHRFIWHSDSVSLTIFFFISSNNFVSTNSKLFIQPRERKRERNGNKTHSIQSTSQNGEKIDYQKCSSWQTTKLFWNIIDVTEVKKIPFKYRNLYVLPISIPFRLSVFE